MLAQVIVHLIGGTCVPVKVLRVGQLKVKVGIFTVQRLPYNHKVFYVVWRRVLNKTCRVEKFRCLSPQIFQGKIRTVFRPKAAGKGPCLSLVGIVKPCLYFYVRRVNHTLSVVVIRYYGPIFCLQVKAVLPFFAKQAQLLGVYGVQIDFYWIGRRKVLHAVHGNVI